MDDVSRSPGRLEQPTHGASRARGPRYNDSLRARLLQVASILAVLGVWELSARLGWVDPLFVAPPSAVVRALGVIGPAALGALADTLGKTALAYAIAVALGVPLGLL